MQVRGSDESRGCGRGASAQTERNISYPPKHQPRTTRRTYAQCQVSRLVKSTIADPIHVYAHLCVLLLPRCFQLTFYVFFYVIVTGI